MAPTGHRSLSATYAWGLATTASRWPWPLPHTLWATPPTGPTWPPSGKPPAPRQSATRTTSTPRARGFLNVWGVQQAGVGTPQLRGFSQAPLQRRRPEERRALRTDLPRHREGHPYVGTHVWPAQAAVHAGMTHVVNAIPDNWPMALHLSEGAIHTVQTPSAYLGSTPSATRTSSPRSTRRTCSCAALTYW